MREALSSHGQARISEAGEWLLRVGGAGAVDSWGDELSPLSPRVWP